MHVISSGPRAPTSPPAGGLGLVAWVPDRSLELAEWVAVGRRLGAIGRCSQWGLGDWIRYGNVKFGERYARAARITGYDPQTLMNMVYVASRFEISRRRESLSWSHHETLAALEREAQEYWLERALAERLSISDLRTELRSLRRDAKRVSVAAEYEPAGLAGAEEEAVRAENGAAVEDGAEAEDANEVLRCPHCGGRVPLGAHEN